MEVLMENLAEQELTTLDQVQLKVEQKTALPENTKKIMGVSCQLYGQNTAIAENEITITGNIVTRLVFINEFDKFDSQDISEPFEKKVVVKDLCGANQILATTNLADSHWQLSDNVVVLDNVLMVVVKGVKNHEMQVVSDLTGDVEVCKTEHQILTFNSAVCDKFEITEDVELDANCEGVLGVDANPNLKDVTASAGKVSIKGTLLVNVLGVKNLDNTSVPYNFTQEIDFAKSINVNGATSEDLAIGTVVINSVKMQIENSHQKAVLKLVIELSVNGCIYSNHKFNTVTDAISFDKELTLQTTELKYVDVLPQVNTCVDLENNINLAPNTPYISHVLAVDGVRINNLQATPADGKTVLEGVLIANLLLENEEHIITGDTFEVPFQTHVRMDNVESNYSVNAEVVPLSVNVKARRGTELLVDAKLAVTVQASTPKSITVVNNLIEGQNKTDDGSAIRIYMIGEKETLWDLAKRTNLSCAALLQQNPNLENGCTPGERIVVYRHENVNL